jgi:solute carrier family 25 carnitine/acylcarnitine transporter 20/29
MDSDSVSNLISGSIAGLVQIATGHPFDTIKVWHVKYGSNHSVVHSLRSMYKMGGMRQFYKGIVPPMYSSVAINMKIYYLHHYFRDKMQFNSFYSGAATGALLSVVESPFDLVKSQMQISREKKSYLKVVKELGFKNMFRGFGCTIIRNVPSVGGYFWAYEETKKRVANPIFGSVFGGAAAGFMCWGPVYPLDYIKTVIQTSNDGDASITSILKKSRFKDYWRGVVPCVVRGVVINPFVFLGYEFGMYYLSHNV